MIACISLLAHAAPGAWTWPQHDQTNEELWNGPGPRPPAMTRLVVKDPPSHGGKQEMWPRARLFALRLLA